MSDPFFVTGPHLPSLRTVCCCEHFWNSWAMTPDNSFTTLKVLKKNFWIARSVILLMIICLDSSWHNSPKECCSAGHSTVSFILSVFKSLEGGGCCRELKLRPKTSWLQLGGGLSEQRDAPFVCLILSCVSRLNGPNCYQHHHQLSFLPEGDRHMHSRHLAHSIQMEMADGMIKLIFNHEDLSKKMFLVAWSCFFSSVHPAYCSVACQHLCCLTDVIKWRLRGNQM